MADLTHRGGREAGNCQGCPYETGFQVDLWGLGDPKGLHPKLAKDFH